MDSYLKQQEDAALDQAILESEKERENIQVRSLIIFNTANMTVYNTKIPSDAQKTPSR
jgi:hypothetical protein